MLFTWFVEGGSWFMGILSVILVALFLASWKAPRWVKEIGLIALAFGFLGTLLGFAQALGYVKQSGPVSQSILCGGLKVSLIPTIYGVIIYLVSLILRIIQKPRL